MSDIFNSDDQTNVTENQNSDDPFATLVGEGKKFKTPADLARGKLEADSFIERLKKENEELRKLSERKDYAEELLAKLQEKAAPSTGVTAIPNNDKGGTAENPNRGAPSEKDIQRLVEEALTTREKTATSSQNIAKATEMVTAEFGEAAQATVAAKAKALGLSMSRMQEIAAESPTAFMQLLGGKSTTNQTVANKGGVSTSSFNTQTSGERNKSYYDNLRRENKKKYFSQEVQTAMLRDAERLGDRFYS